MACRLGFCPTFLFSALLLLALPIHAQDLATPNENARTSASLGDQIEFFESRIRPVLSEQCYSCHNSHGTAEADLALDHRAGMFGDSDPQPLIIAGQPEQSRLMAILRHEVDGLEMPEDGPRLSDSILADFEKWIQDGAHDPRDAPASADEMTDAMSWESTLERRKKWWSFQPIRDPSVPAIEDEASDAKPIDKFILARLNAQGLQPTLQASPRMLVRRLYLTLIGIPPSVAESAAWTQQYELAADPSNVTEKLVDHLLSSKHYGERWARHWMDWIRYAESHGSEGDPRIDEAWRYRDYLIRALNNDVPYNQLVREHVAGDLMNKPRVNRDLGINESVIATSHWRMVFHGFAPTDPLDEKVRFIDDEINAFSKAFLGVTVSCARCHDHKFDAISQADYYALFGILASCRPGRTTMDLPEREELHFAELSDLKQQIRNTLAGEWLASMESVADRLAAIRFDPEKPHEVSSILHAIASFDQAPQAKRAQRWNQSVGLRDDSDSDSYIAHWNLGDGNDLAEWTSVGLGLKHAPSDPGEFTIAAEGQTAVSGIYPSGSYSHLVSDKHAARLTSPDFQIDGAYDVWLKVIGDGGSTARYVVQDYPRNGTVYPVRKLGPKWKWERFDLNYWQGDQAHLEIVTARDAPLLVQKTDRAWFGVSDVRIVPKGSSAPSNRPAFLESLELFTQRLGIPQDRNAANELYLAAIKDAIEAWRDDEASNAQSSLLDGCLQEKLLTNSLAALPQSSQLIARYRKLERDVPVPVRIPSLEETRGRTQALFVRGDHRKPAEVIPRRFLEAIDASEYGYDSSGRLQLGEDLIRDDNPLTRRVIVNRIWHHLFGRGIVGTPDNLGRMGEIPTHPELLDWLACRLVDDGWSLKATIRRIVLSKTWQQSSRGPEAARLKDPGNLYLARANLRRLDAETIRDSLLSVSGDLDRQSYGAPVNGTSNRRSVYVRVIRNSLDPFLRVFDFPEPFSSTGRRDVTNVPAQSLALMNDPFVRKQAARLAQQTVPEADAHQTDRTRIGNVFATVFGREPTPAETDSATAYVNESIVHFETLDAKRKDSKTRLASIEKSIRELDDAAQQRFKQRVPKKSDSPPPRPFVMWEFDGDLKDSIGERHLETHGGARVEDGCLVLAKNGYATTKPLGRSIREKTLEAWVQLDNVAQRGGGVVTLQTGDGSRFDSIVLGEQKPGEWLAGSNHFARTEPFGGPAEEEATTRMVQFAIVYHEDGRIIGYRDGVPYGDGFTSRGVQEFAGENSVVSLGIRHFPAGGNRMLKGRIARAALYDRALTPAEIEASVESFGEFVTAKRLLAELTDTERSRRESLVKSADDLRSEIDSMADPSASAEIAAWTEVIHGMLLSKEFIYVP